MHSKWEHNDMLMKITEVLSDPKYDSNHHFERPFLTPYQIGIELVSRHPMICKDLGKSFGGQGTGEYISLVQYIARDLSSRIKSKAITHIQGIHLCNEHLKEYTFWGPDGSEVSVPNRGQEHLSLYRLVTPS